VNPKSYGKPERKIGDLTDNKECKLFYISQVSSNGQTNSKYDLYGNNSSYERMKDITL
jgi:hypothetical protein